MYAKRELRLGLNDSLFLTEAELISNVFETTQLPSNWQLRWVTQMKCTGLLAAQQNSVQYISGKSNFLEKYIPNVQYIYHLPTGEVRLFQSPSSSSQGGFLAGLHDS